MAASKPEVLISQLLDKIATKFQILHSSFRTHDMMSVALQRILHDVTICPKSTMAADKPEKPVYRVYTRYRFEIPTSGSDIAATRVKKLLSQRCAVVWAINLLDERPFGDGDRQTVGRKTTGRYFRTIGRQPKNTIGRQIVIHISLLGGRHPQHVDIHFTRIDRLSSEVVACRPVRGVCTQRQCCRR